MYLASFAANMLCMFNFCRLAYCASSTEFLKHQSFGQFVLQIIPPQYWEAVASYIPLQIQFEYLHKLLVQKKVHMAYTETLIMSFC